MSFQDCFGSGDLSNLSGYDEKKKREHDKTGVDHNKYYQNLGIKFGSSYEKVKLAYQKILLTSHPDRKQNKEKQEEAKSAAEAAASSAAQSPRSRSRSTKPPAVPGLNISSSWRDPEVRSAATTG